MVHRGFAHGTRQRGIPASTRPRGEPRRGPPTPRGEPGCPTRRRARFGRLASFPRQLFGSDRKSRSWQRLVSLASTPVKQSVWGGFLLQVGHTAEFPRSALAKARELLFVVVHGRAQHSG